jgi:hypothetical protein
MCIVAYQPDWQGARKTRISGAGAGQKKAGH